MENSNNRFKFRAWNKEKKKMDYLESEYVSEALSYYENGTSYLMQFTGLTDKNGKDIYEGDIVKMYDELKKIEWDEHTAGFGWSNMRMSEYLMLRKYTAEKCEVIGTIYENPNLIKPKQ